MHQLPQVVRLERTSSTNTYLANLWEDQGAALPPYLTVVTDFQEAGRGRLAREWVAPAGTSMLASILVPTDGSHATWLPLVAGMCLAELLTSLLPSSSVTLKWPNDVLVEGKKISGILCEHLGALDTAPEMQWIAVGIGLNLTQGTDELPPVPSTSVALEGGPPVDPALLAVACAASLQDLLSDPFAQLAAKVAQACSTPGLPVVASLPSGHIVEGTAVGLHNDGALLVKDPRGEVHVLRAGDLVHLRQRSAYRQPFCPPPRRFIAHARPGDRAPNLIAHEGVRS